MTALVLASGVALLLLLVLDVFGTVFNPEGHGGPLTRVQSRAMWKTWKAVAPAGREGRNRWLALGGPALALMTPATWALILVCGFALIYYPWVAEFLVSPGSLRALWSEALYVSGFAAATLGSGDIVPDQPILRLLTVVEALCGFALLSASLSYILAVYRENGIKTTLASELALNYDLMEKGAELQPDGLDHLWLKGIARELLHVANAHAQYPILHFFRPRDPSSSLALQIAPLLPGIGEILESDARAARIAGAAVDRYLDAADTRFVPRAVSPLGDVGDARYGRLLHYLGYRAEDAAA